MELFDPILELIDLRSFSNLWFWIVLAVMWSTASHYVLGVPYDMVQRARRKGGETQIDVEALIAIYAKRLDYIATVSGLILVGAVFFLLTALAVLGFVYRVEFCQAVFLLALPMSLVWYLGLRTARRILRKGLLGEALFDALRVHRFVVQVIGMIAIFITATWGMYQNLSAVVLPH